MTTTVANAHAGRAAFDVYVGRVMPGREEKTGPTDGIFGNPYSVKEYADEAGPLFVKYFLWRVEAEPKFRVQVEQLRGKRLACWCAPHRACHAEVIAAWLDGNWALIEERRTAAGWLPKPKAKPQGDLFAKGGTS